MASSENGPYFKTDTTDFYLDIMNKPKLKSSLDDKYYTVESKYEYRPDLLSNDTYGTPKYWYVFILRNMDLMEDPIFDLEAGMTIRIPTTSNVRNIS